MLLPGGVDAAAAADDAAVSANVCIILCPPKHRHIRRILRRIAVEWR